MTDVTDADRRRAFRALGWHESWGLDDLSDSDRNEVEDIAAALAEERAKARAPFLAVLADIDDGFFAPESYDKGVRWASDRIRRAAQETE